MKLSSEGPDSNTVDELEQVGRSFETDASAPTLLQTGCWTLPVALSQPVLETIDQASTTGGAADQRDIPARRPDGDRAVRARAHRLGPAGPIDLEMEIGQDAAEALKPAPKGCFVVALTTNCVGAAEPVMDVRHGRFQQLIPAMVVDVVEASADQSLDEVAIEQFKLPPGS